jgi:hypothetical protein
MSCNCIEKVETELKKYYENVKINTAIQQTGEERCYTEFSHKVNKRNSTGTITKKRTLIFTYCPFCGKKYE